MGIFDERKTYKPFEYEHITKPFIEAMWASHWTHKEFSFNSDVQDFNTKLSPEEQGVIKRSVLMISQVEVSVKSYWSNIGVLFPKPEIGDMGGTFGGVEVIHSLGYAEILSKLGLNDEFQAILATGVVNNRVTYLRKYVNKIYKNDRKNKIYSLILFTLFTENISLFSQFFIILGFNRFRNVMKDVSNVVQYTSKEENLHALGGIALLNQIRLEYPELFDEELYAKVKEEVMEAINSESEIIDWILQGYENEFISKDILHCYLKRRMNESLTQIGFDNFKLDLNPEDVQKTLWMDEEIFAPALTDFFHKKPIDYTKKNQEFTTSDLF